MARTAALFFFVFLAGFVDSIAGGGGLISLPAYLTLGPGGVAALATNKFSASFGSTIASVNYIRNRAYHPASLPWAIGASLVGSVAGARLSLVVNERVFFIMLLFVIPSLGAMLLAKREFTGKTPKAHGKTLIAICAAVSFAVGAYDGFYGPGSGTILMTCFILIAGLDTHTAGGNSRIVNWASTTGSLVTYIIYGRVDYALGIPCAFCSILGNYLGSSYSLKRNARIVRPLMVAVTTLLFFTTLIRLIHG